MPIDTVHSVNQLKSFGLIVDDVPLRFSGQKYIITPDGYHIPLSIHNGLPWTDMSAPNPTEFLSYPHVIFISDMPWDPQVYDHEYNIHVLQPPTDITLLNPTYHSETMNDFGEMTFYDVNYQHVHPKQIDFSSLLTNFGYVPIDRIKHTLKHTTQFACLHTRLPLC
jgi:hypothetical protein